MRITRLAKRDLRSFFYFAYLPVSIEPFVFTKPSHRIELVTHCHGLPTLLISLVSSLFATLYGGIALRSDFAVPTVQWVRME